MLSDLTASAPWESEKGKGDEDQPGTRRGHERDENNKGLPDDGFIQ